MRFSALGPSAIAAGSAALISLLPLSSANAAVHRHGPAGMSVHRTEARSIHAVHRTALGAGNRHFARSGAVGHRTARGWGHGYASGWSGATVSGTTVVGGGYSPYYNYSGGVAYGYRHHSCRWYYYNEPYHVPSWCGSYGYGGPSYTISYGSYGGGSAYWHGHHQHYAGKSSREFVSVSRAHVASGVRVNGGDLHSMAMHGSKEARLPRPGGHLKVH